MFYSCGRLLLKITDVIFTPILFYGHTHEKKVLYKLSPSLRFIMRPRASDKTTVWEIWKSKVYESKKHPITKNSIVLDIGAHIGAFTVFAAKKAAKGYVYAYEASPESYALLQENISINKLHNVHAYNIAISKQKGTIAFYTDSANFVLNSIHPIKGARKNIIPCISLTDIFQQNKLLHIDYMKMDVEGAEYEILLNTPQTIMKKISYISLEYHVLPHISHKPADLINFLHTCGFKTKIEGSFMQKLFFQTGYIRAWK